MFGQSSKSVPKSVFVSQPVGVNARRSWDQKAVISECVQVWLRSVQ